MILTKSLPAQVIIRNVRTWSNGRALRLSWSGARSPSGSIPTYSQDLYTGSMYTVSSVLFYCMRLLDGSPGYPDFSLSGTISVRQCVDLWMKFLIRFLVVACLAVCSRSACFIISLPTFPLASSKHRFSRVPQKITPVLLSASGRRT
jgi:hypothetical protein